MPVQRVTVQALVGTSSGSVVSAPSMRSVRDESPVIHCHSSSSSPSICQKHEQVTEFVECAVPVAPLEGVESHSLHASAPHQNQQARNQRKRRH